MATRQHSADAWDADAAAHLLSRAAFGPTPEAVARLTAMTRHEAVETLIVDATWAPLPVPPDWVRHPWLNTQRGWADTPPDVLADNHGRTTARYAVEMDGLRAWWLREMVRTPGPLREVMTLFWHGHFTSSYQKVLISQSMYEQNAVFRRHALGNFRQLLNAVLRDSAMMLYLDMEEMTGERHNENLARELCELFTLGVGNYSEADVREIARALTGWTLDVPAGVVMPNRPDAPRLHRALRRDGLVARFVPERHDGGTKTILGRSGAFGLQRRRRHPRGPPRYGPVRGGPAHRLLRGERSARRVAGASGRHLHGPRRERRADGQGGRGAAGISGVRRRRGPREPGQEPGPVAGRRRPATRPRDRPHPQSRPLRGGDGTEALRSAQRQGMAGG